MKRFIIYIIILFCSRAVPVTAQAAKQLLYNFNPDTILSSGCYGHCAEDSFFITAGNVGGHNLSAYLATFDYHLNLKKKKYLTFAGDINGLTWRTIAKMGPDKYVVAGLYDNLTINSRIKPIEQPYFYIFDSNLDSIKFQSYYLDTIFGKVPWSITIDKQKNILVTGHSNSASLFLASWDHAWYHDSEYIWVAKYDSVANLIWEKNLWGLPTQLSGLKILPNKDSTSYLFSGFTTNPDSGKIDIFIAKMDTTGNILWRKFLRRPFSNITWTDMDIIPLMTGNYAFLSTYSDSVYHTSSGDYPANSFFYFGKMNENGDILWAKHIKTCECACRGGQIAEAENGDWFLLGTHDSSISIPTMLRTDSVGNLLWYRSYQYNKVDIVPRFEFHGFSYTASKQFLFSGIAKSGTTTADFDSVGSLSLFILTDTLGCIDPDCNLEVISPGHFGSKVKAYPNPFSNEITIENAKGAQAILMDVMGRTLYQTNINAEKQTVLLPDIPAGLYYLQLIHPGLKPETVKLVRE